MRLKDSNAAEFKFKFLFMAESQSSLRDQGRLFGFVLMTEKDKKGEQNEKV
jgi:hypothetical protein